MEVIRPAVEGTKAVLAACKAAGVRRITLTSSLVAIWSTPADKRPEVFDESHWSDLHQENMPVYDKSKSLAELAAWEFIENLPDDDKMELSVVNPGLVMGPTMNRC
jgi:dihydroflavonol-4-reductase